MSVFDSSSTVNTTLPSWFSTAQQDIALKAPTTLSAATTPANSVLSGVVNNLNSETANPFTSAISGLQTAQNANLNPWLPSGAPNTATPLGGLFAAQNAKLDQMLPEIAAKEGAAGIAGGNYGSLRGQTAVNTARAGALTTLAEQQNKAAIDAMNQSIQAGSALGNVGSQYGTTGVNVAKQEMGGGLDQLAKYSDIINAMGPTANKSVETVTSKGDYANFLAALQAIGGGGQALDNIMSGKSSYDWLNKLINNTDFAYSSGGNNADSMYGGDTSNPGHWEGGEWVED